MIDYVDPELAAEEMSKRSDKDISADKTLPTFGAERFMVTITPANLRKMGLPVQTLEDPALYDTIERFLRSCGDTDGYRVCFTVCRSAKAYYHIHAAIQTDHTVRWKALHKALGKAWVAPQRGTCDQLRAYIDKEGDWEEKGETILFRGGDFSILESRQGQRTDLITFDQLCVQPGFDFDEWVMMNIPPEASREISMYRTRYECAIRSQAKRRQRDHIRVIWIEGAAGTGKSWSVYASKGGMFDDSDVCRYDFSSQNFPLNAYVGQSVLHLDELRPGMIKLDRLLALMDPLPLPVDVKNGRMVACWDTVVITSAFPLREWYTSEDGDTEDLLSRRAQLMRRIDEHYIVTRDHQRHLDLSFPVYKEVLLHAVDALQQKKVLGGSDGHLTMIDSLFVELRRLGLPVVLPGTAPPALPG